MKNKTIAVLGVDGQPRLAHELGPVVPDVMQRTAAQKGAASYSGDAGRKVNGADCGMVTERIRADIGDARLHVDNLNIIPVLVPGHRRCEAGPVRHGA